MLLKKREEKDRVQLLMHNAEQMLEVVKVTFSGFEYRTMEDTACASSIHSDEVRLSCLWAKASEMRALWQVEKAHVDQVVEELLRVSLSAKDICQTLTPEI